jgi:hypothetical protein
MAGVGADLGGVRGGGRAAGQHEMGDRGNRGQRLAAEAQCQDRFEFVQRGDLAGGVAHQRDGQFVGGDAAAVVGDDDASHAAFLEPDTQLRGAGVECVLEQFLDDRRGPFHHFTGGDLADQLVRQRANGAVGLGGARMGTVGFGRHVGDYTCARTRIRHSPGIFRAR